MISCAGGADVNTADASYMYHYPNSPRVPQPLLAAAWELDSYDVIDLLMKYQPDTSRMYINHRWKQPMPLFFHVRIVMYCQLDLHKRARVWTLISMHSTIGRQTL